MEGIKKHPKELYSLCIIEALERFSYYGLRAILLIFALKTELINKDSANGFYEQFILLTYLLPAVSGYAGDIFIGRTKSMQIGLGVALAGIAMLIPVTLISAGDIQKYLGYVALTLIIVGTGFFKPHISVAIGALYAKDDYRLDSAYTIFYFYINTGAFLGGMLVSYFIDNFLAAFVIILIAIAIANYMMYKRRVVHDIKKDVDHLPQPHLRTKYSNVIAFTLIALMLVISFFVLRLSKFDNTSMLPIYLVVFPVFMIYLFIKGKREGVRRNFKFLLICILSALFWIMTEFGGSFLFDRQGLAFEGGILLPNSYLINALIILVMAPIINMSWNTINRQNSIASKPFFKLGLGFFVLAMSSIFIKLAFAESGGTNSDMVVVFFTLQTIAELITIPILLSTVYRLFSGVHHAFYYAAYFITYQTGYLTYLRSRAFMIPNKTQNAADISDKNYIAALLIIPTGIALILFIRFFGKELMTFRKKKQVN